MTIKSFKINYSNIGGSKYVPPHRRERNENNEIRATPLEQKGRTLEQLERNWSPSSYRSRGQKSNFSSSHEPNWRSIKGNNKKDDNRKVSSNECSDSNFYRNNIDNFFKNKLEELNFDETWTIDDTTSIYKSTEPDQTLKNFVKKFMLECFPNLIKWFNGRTRNNFFPISFYLENEYFLDMLSGPPKDIYKIGIFITSNTDSRIGKAIKLYNNHMRFLHELLYKKRKSVTTPTPTPTSYLNQDLVNKHLEELSKLHFDNVNIITSQNIDFKYNKNSNNYSCNLEGNSDSEIINNNNEYISYIEELNPRAFDEGRYKNFYFIDYSNLILGIRQFEKLGLSGDPWWGNFHARMMTKVISFFVSKKIKEIKNKIEYNELQFNFYLFTKKDSGYHDPYNRQYNRQYEDDNILPIPIKFTIEDGRLKELIREGIEINTELSLCTNREINNEDKSRLIDSQKNLDLFQAINQYNETIKKIGQVSEKILKKGKDKSALHSITSFDDACLLKKYAIMKNRFENENANFYLISGDRYKDRATDDSIDFSETLNFFNHNEDEGEDLSGNLSTLGKLMDNYNKNDPVFRKKIKNLARNVSVAPFIERSIKYDVNILNDENIIFTSEKEEMGENILTDYKFYIHSLPIFDRNFDVTFESPRI